MKQMRTRTRATIGTISGVVRLAPASSSPPLDLAPGGAAADGVEMTATALPWYVWAVLAAVFAALTAIFGKVGVQDLNPDYATLIRTGVILVVLAALVTITGAWQPPSTVSARSWTFLVLSGLATGASWLAYYRALKVGQASQVAPIDKLSVAMVAVFAALFLGERLSARNWLGVGLVAAGVLLVAAKR